MKVNFWIDDHGYGRDRTLTIEMKLNHDITSDKIYSTAYKLDLSKPIELALVYDALKNMERQTAEFAGKRLNMYKAEEYRNVEYLEERIRDLNKQLSMFMRLGKGE
jgi:hypothetical protein